MQDDKHTGRDGIDQKLLQETLVNDLKALSEEEARKKIAIEPFYDNIENQITQSKQGIWVTAYFLTKWKPALGHPAADIVLALQKAADRKTGETTASLENIAKLAGVSRSTLALWLSPNPKPWKTKSRQQREQWELLHKYWVKEIKRRYRQSRNAQGVSRTRQTTNRIRVTVDDPVHPDDLSRLYALYAERMLKQNPIDDRNTPKNKDFAYESDSRIHRNPKEIVSDDPVVENSSYESDSRTQTGVRLSDTRLSLSDRSNNVSNVRVTTEGKQTHRTKLGAGLSPDVWAHKERKAYQLGAELKLMAGDRSEGEHKDQAFLMRVAFLMPEPRIDEALRATRDAVDDVRAGKKSLRKGAAAYFTGVILNMAQEDGITLVDSPTYSHPEPTPSPTNEKPQAPPAVGQDPDKSPPSISREEFKQARQELFSKMDL